MRLINKESVTRVVDECYPSSKYKIFTINSVDGVKFTKPIGLFVSLGITTSLDTIRKVSKSISNKLGTESHISEIESRLVSGEGYLNKVSRYDVSDQYDSGAIHEGKIVSYSEIKELVNYFKSKIVENNSNDDQLVSYAHKLSKVDRFIKKFEMSKTTSSENYLISITDIDTEFNITVINKKINYIQSKELYNDKEIIVHKRIGILVKF